MGIAERLLQVGVACFAILLVAGVGARLASPALQLASSAVATAALLTVLAFGLATLRPGPPGALAERLGLRAGRLPAWSVALLCVGTLALSHALDIAIHMLRVEQVGVLPRVDQALRTAQGGELGVALLAIAIAAGVGEELFFRGLVQRSTQRALRGWPRGPLAAIVVSAALFGALHFDPIHSPAAFILGLYLGGVALLADSVRASIVCHVVNNAVAVGDSVYGWSLPGSSLASFALWLAVAGAAFAIAARRRGRAPAAVDFSPAPGWPTREP